MTEPIRWSVQDRSGNNIYLTQQRWEHIIESINHPEMEDYEEELKETVKTGSRKQDSLNPKSIVTRRNLTICQPATLTLSLLFCSNYRNARWVKLYRTTLLSPLTRKKQGNKMSQPAINYDEVSDTLYMSFIPDLKATGIELNEHILLRIDKESARAVGITFLNYSILIQKADFGPRSFPLTGLAKLSEETYETVMHILATAPVKEVLSLSTYTPSLSEALPIALLHLPEPA